MKRTLRDLALSLLLMFAAVQASAQLFPQPQPYMYDRGYEAYTSVKGVRRMVFSRYIAGARFPKDWDVIVESYTYDKEGHLTQWNRYQNITGEATLQSSYVWADGHLQSENIMLANDHSEIQRNYNWEKDASGKYTKAIITDKAKKPVATLEILPNGGYVHTETSLGNGKYQRSTYNAARQLIKTENTASGLVEDYTYDANGVLASVDVKSGNGNNVKIQYTNKLDDKGRIVSQTESGRGAPKTYYFNYDAAGHLIEKGITPKQPLELRGYDPMGRLSDINIFDTAGFPKEVLNISYEGFTVK